MKKSFKLAKCFCCYSGYPCGKVPRLPRKKKKQLKVYESYIASFTSGYYGIGEDTTTCNMAGVYKAVKKYFKLIPFFKKHRAAFTHVLRNTDFGEPIKLGLEDGNFSLNFSWETDNGLYCESGIMPFIYNADNWDKTWAGEQTYEVLTGCGIQFGTVLNDKEFIAALSARMKSKTWLNEEAAHEEAMAYLAL